MQTIFCVQTFWRQGFKMEPGQLHQFADEQEARAVGKRLSARRPGVVVYSVRGQPEEDFWSDPLIIARYGEAPIGVSGW